MTCKFWKYCKGYESNSNTCNQFCDRRYCGKYREFSEKKQQGVTYKKIVTYKETPTGFWLGWMLVIASAIAYPVLYVLENREVKYVEVKR